MTETDSTDRPTRRANLLIKDYLSSTRVIINDKGEIGETPRYYPYGSTLVIANLSEVEGEAISKRDGIALSSDDSGTPDNDMSATDRLFTGHRKVDALNIYHAGARFFSPQLGIFIQPDTAEGPNRYGYVAGNPVMGNDPTGHCTNCRPRLSDIQSGEGGGIRATGVINPGPEDVSDIYYSIMYGVPAGIALYSGGYAAYTAGAAGAATVASATTMVRQGASVLQSLQAACMGANCVQKSIPLAEMTMGDALPPGQSLGSVPGVYTKYAARSTTPSRLGIEFPAGGAAEFNTLVALHNVSPANVARPINLLSDSRGEAIGYDAERIVGESLMDHILRIGALEEGLYGRIKTTVNRFHRAGLAHGDLNMGNIIITPENQLVFIDPVGYVGTLNQDQWSELIAIDKGMVDSMPSRAKVLLDMQR